MGGNISTSAAGGRYFQTNTVNHGKMRKRERLAADISNTISAFDIAERALPFVGFLGSLFGLGGGGSNVRVSLNENTFNQNNHRYSYAEKQSAWEQSGGRGSRTYNPFAQGGSRYEPYNQNLRRSPIIYRTRPAVSQNLYQRTRAGVEKQLERTYGRYTYGKDGKPMGYRFQSGALFDKAGIPPQAAAYRANGTFAYTDRVFRSR